MQIFTVFLNLWLYLLSVVLLVLSIIQYIDTVIAGEVNAASGVAVHFIVITIVAAAVLTVAVVIIIRLKRTPRHCTSCEYKCMCAIFSLSLMHLCNTESDKNVPTCIG